MGIYASWFFHWYCINHANNWEDVCQSVFSLVLYISCQQFMGIYVIWCFQRYCIYPANNVGDVCQLVSFIIFVYIMPDGVNIMTSVGVFVGILYIMQTIGVSVSYFGVFGVGSLWALRPLGGGR